MISKIKREVYIDFEFNNTQEYNLNLVCCVTLDTVNGLKKWWLHKDSKAQESLAKFLTQFDTFVAYAAVAESRSLLSMKVDPYKFQVIDLMLEYKCLSNHNDELNYGEHLVDGKIKAIKKPKNPYSPQPGEGGFKHTHSLAEASFKFCKVIRDTEHKDKMRDLIISAPQIFTENEQHQIMEYCAEDVKFLPTLRSQMDKMFLKKNKDLDFKINLEEAQLERGKYAVLTAYMERRGYPFDFDKTLNFSKQVGNILYDCQREINKLFPKIKPFRWDKANNRFAWNQIATKLWIMEQGLASSWTKTEKNQLALSLDAFQEKFNFQHEYPEDNFGAQMVRYLKLKQSLNGFTPTKGKRTFWDYMGTDRRVRPYFNPYGSQSSRSQPAATGFLMLKPAWMRALMQPRPGKAIGGIDYGSQEFFISALMSEDKNMIASYLSGDVYLAFGKLTKMIPPNGTKETHKKLRDLCKSTVLGISYLMGAKNLAIKLSNDSGAEYKEEFAQQMIDLFYEAYPDFAEYQGAIKDLYSSRKTVVLQDGWQMFGDNPNHRSVANMPIQGTGAAIMRKAVDLCHQRNVEVILTLHDALYIEFDSNDGSKMKILKECMIEAFEFFAPKDFKHLARKIKLDPFIWSPDYPEEGEIDCDGYKVECSNIYIDPRAISEYEKFSKYFNPREEDQL